MKRTVENKPSEQEIKQLYQYDNMNLENLVVSGVIWVSIPLVNTLS